MNRHCCVAKKAMGAESSLHEVCGWGCAPSALSGTSHPVYRKQCRGVMPSGQAHEERARLPAQGVNRAPSVPDTQAVSKYLERYYDLCSLKVLNVKLFLPFLRPRLYVTTSFRGTNFILCSVARAYASAVIFFSATQLQCNQNWCC